MRSLRESSEEDRTDGSMIEHAQADVVAGIGPPLDLGPRKPRTRGNPGVRRLRPNALCPIRLNYENLVAVILKGLCGSLHYRQRTRTARCYCKSRIDALECHANTPIGCRS